MTNKIVLVCSLAAAASLFFLYVLFAGLFLVERLVFSSLTLVELIVVVIQFVKVAGLVGFYHTQAPRIEIMLILFSLEIFAVMFIVVAYAGTGDIYLSNLANTIFSTWIAAITLALPPYLIYVSVYQMIRSKNPILVILFPALIFGFLAFASSALYSFVNTFSFATFIQFLLGALKFDLNAGTIPGLASVYLLVPSVAMFCALFVRITIPTPTSATPPRVSFFLPLLGAIVGLGWASASVRLVPNTLLSFTVPGVAIAAVLYVYMRR